MGARRGSPEAAQGSRAQAPGQTKKGAIAGGTINYDAFPIEAWSRRDPQNPITGLSDPEARVGRGKKGAFFLCYKGHCGGDWNIIYVTG